MGALQSSQRECQVNGEDYYLGRTIGKGAYAVVHALYTKPYKRKKILAVKLFNKRTVIDNDQLRFLLIERGILIRVADAPFVCNILSAYQTPRQLALVTPFMSGGDLGGLLHDRGERGLREASAAFILSNITLALEYLHNHLIIHRDVKTDNILLHEGYAYLTDFNCCKELTSREDKGGSRTGTPAYMAPEVADARPYGVEVDWWSLGITLYEMLVGKRPFEHQDPDTFLKILKEANLRFPKKLSDSAKSIITGLVCVDPQARYGVQEVKSHSFLQDIDWEKMMKKELESPIPSSMPQVYPDMEIGAYCAPVSGKVSIEEQAAFSDWDWPKPLISARQSAAAAMVESTTAESVLSDDSDEARVSRTRSQQAFFHYEKEVAWFENPCALQRHGMILNMVDKDDRGKVIFSLSELEIGVEYITVAGSKLIRTSESEAILIGGKTSKRLCVTKKIHGEVIAVKEKKTELKTEESKKDLDEKDKDVQAAGRIRKEEKKSVLGTAVHGSHVRDTCMPPKHEEEASVSMDEEKIKSN